MVDRLGETRLEDLGLQPALQEIFNLQRQDVIETHAVLVEHTDTDEPTDEGVTLEETLGVLRVELEQLTGRTTNLGQDKTDTPNLALVAQAVLAGELQLRIETGVLEGATGDLVTVESQKYGARLDQHGASLHIVDLEEKKAHVLLWFLGALNAKHQHTNKVRARWEGHYLGIFLEDGGYDGEV